MQSRISLAELIDSDVSLRPDQAVAILREVCRQYAAGELRGIPNATVIRLTSDGYVCVEGPVNRDQDAVLAAAALLDDLLPGFDTPTGFKVPGGLRLVLARATRTLDLPPFRDVGEFCASLQRFAAADLGTTVSGLYAVYASRHADQAIVPAVRETTISDIRRARRATGLSLEDVAQAAGVPSAKLRELEWGYMRNWRADDTSRDELRRYARVTGLDEQLVMSVAWPLIDAAAEPGTVVDAEPAPAAAEWALVAEPDRALVPLRWPEPAATSRPPHAWRRYGWIMALAAAVVIVMVSMAAWWPRAVPAPVVADRAAAPETQPALDGPVPEPQPPAAAAPAAAHPAAFVRPAPAHPRTSKAKPKPAPRQHKSFFKRELFRIVIK